MTNMKYDDYVLLVFDDYTETIEQITDLVDRDCKGDISTEEFRNQVINAIYNLENKLENKGE